MDFWLETLKTNVEIRVDILEIPCVATFRQNGQVWLFLAKFAQKWILGSEFQKPKSAFEISAFNIPLCQFSVKMDSFDFFRLNLGKLPNYVRYFNSNNDEAIAESWVKTEMNWVGVDVAEWSWVKVDGAGWSWVNGLLIPNFTMLIKKTCSTVKWQYLSCYFSSWFRWKWRSSQIQQYKELALLRLCTPPRFRKCSYRSLFLFCTACHNQNIVQRNTEFCISSYFHRTLIGFKLPI